MNTQISYIKTEIDGVVSEEIKITCPQIGYTNSVTLGTISLKTAHELLKALSEKLSEIPY